MIKNTTTRLSFRSAALDTPVLSTNSAPSPGIVIPNVERNLDLSYSVLPRLFEGLFRVSMLVLRKVEGYGLSILCASASLREKNSAMVSLPASGGLARAFTRDPSRARPRDNRERNHAFPYPEAACSVAASLSFRNIFNPLRVFMVLKKMLR